MRVLRGGSLSCQASATRSTVRRLTAPSAASTSGSSASATPCAASSASASGVPASNHSYAWSMRVRKSRSRWSSGSRRRPTTVTSWADRAHAVHETMRAMATLRELLAAARPVLAPGAYDALSARLVERAGFPAVYMTGFGASASLLGRPGRRAAVVRRDGRPRAAARAGGRRAADRRRRRRLRQPAQRACARCASTRRPGSPRCTSRTRSRPKRCGHMEGKEVIAAGEMVEKVRAAVEARGDAGPADHRPHRRARGRGPRRRARARAALPRGRRRRAVRRGAARPRREIEAVAAAFPDGRSCSTGSTAARRRSSRSTASASSASRS